MRQLENTVRQALLLGRPFGVSVEHVQEALSRSARPIQVRDQTHGAFIADLLARAQRGEVTDAYSRMVTELEPELFVQALQLARGNQAQVARWLGIGRLRLREKLITLGLHPGSQGPGA